MRRYYKDIEKMKKNEQQIVLRKLRHVSLMQDRRAAPLRPNDYKIDTKYTGYAHSEHVNQKPGQN